MFTTRPILTILCLLFAATTVTSANAQQAQTPPATDLMPPKAATTDIESNIDINANTHPPVRLTPDKSELIKLPRDAVSIIVGNPEHLSILADSSRTLVLVPKTPGATHFSVLDSKGEIIMQRHAIVASPKKQYVRVRNTCASTTNEDCQNTQVFYCPDMCHQIALAKGDTPSSSSPASNAAETASQAGTPPTSPPPTDNDSE